jgi:Tol biopolymer transport system component
MRTVILILYCLSSAAGARDLPSVQPAQCLTPDGGRLPAFLPDGKEIVYVQDTPKGQQVTLMDLTTRKTRLVGEPTDVQSLCASPDGTWIAITSGLVFARRIERMNLSDGKRKTLTDGPGFRSSPSWIDGGKFLYFSLKQQGKVKWIQMNPFADPPTLEELEPLGPGEPTISPKGNFIALVTRNERGTALLKIVDKDGKTIADIPPVETNSTTPARGCYDPAFSPDETFLLYVRSDIQPMSDIVLRDLKTGGEIPITSDRLNNQSPVFSPDGKTVVYASQKDGNQLRLWLVRLKPANGNSASSSNESVQ